MNNNILAGGIAPNDYGNTYELVSKVAYLIGVSRRIFENENEPPQMDVFLRLEQDRPARIVRHLCILRTSIERNFKLISEAMRFQFRTLYSMPQWVPGESLRQLDEDGVDFMKHSSTKLCHHVIEINRLISDRINNCREPFPLWVNWQYIRELFIMPDGLTEEGTKAAAEVYYTNRGAYPYQMYINWNPVNDKLCATLKSLDYQHTSKISQIILFDDVHTATAWEILEQHTKLPVEHILIERVKENKSLVDITLTARASKEHYQNRVDSFIIVSSDSDYWGLISVLNEARFLVMVEREKCGPDMKRALVESGIFYCYIDNFYSANSESILMSALFKELYRYLDHAVQLNANEMLDEALRATRINMSPAEKRQFFEKHIKGMRLVIDGDGNVSVELKR